MRVSFVGTLTVMVRKSVGVLVSFSEIPTEEQRKPLLVGFVEGRVSLQSELERSDQRVR